MADYDPLRPVDNEGPCFGHQREISHKDFLFFDLSGLFVDEAHSHLQGCRVGHVPFFALINIPLGFSQGIVEELKNQIAGEILDW